MIQQIAPTLFAALSRDEAHSLQRLRSSLAQTVEAWQPVTVQYTDHSMAHIDAILRVVETYLVSQDAKLTGVEAFALISAIYLHDTGLIAGEMLRDEQGRLPIECWPPDVRRHHATLSAALVREPALQARAGVALPVLSMPLASLIADLCQVHDRMESLARLGAWRTIDNSDTRPRFLAALLILGDSLHTGRSRVLVENLGLAQLPIEDRLFWYRYSCIDSVNIAPPKATLSLLRSPEVDAISFRRYVRDPIMRHFNEVFSWLNPVFLEFGFAALTCEAQTSGGDVPGTDTTRALLSTAVLETDIRRRNADRKTAIANKIKRKGLIERNLINNELVILRRWSSYTPRMPNWNDLAGQPLPGPYESRGGGYFLVWRKTGIVLDPGYDFLKNFWAQQIHGHEGFELSDIGAVIISHAHDDHSHDIEPILSLLHNRRKRTGRRTLLPLYVSEGTHCKYERLLSITDSAKVLNIVPSTGVCSLPDDEFFLRRRGISLDFIRTEHNEMPWMRNHTGIALKIKLGNDHNRLVIGYTSDTRYFSALIQFFSDVDLLLMHFGNLGPPSGSLDRYDSNHLGLNGCHDLLTNLANSNIRLFLLDEFGEEEIGGDRIKLCDLLAGMCSLGSYGKVLLPMDIGMRVRLPSLEVLCQEQGHNHWVQPKKIVPHLPAGSDGIVYYCH